MKKIAFLLPGPTRYISGGYKIFYEYADFLSNAGCSVDIIYLLDNKITRKNFSGIRGLLKKIYYQVSDFYSWFPFRSSVKHVISKGVDVDKYDCFIFSAIDIAVYLSLFVKEEDKSKFIYFVQGYEVWNYSASEVYDSYRFGFNIISISSYLTGHVDNSGANVSLFLPNGIDSEFIVLPNSVTEKNSLLFMFHPGVNKGCDKIIDNLEVFSEVFSSIKCFSTYKKPVSFPSNVEFIYQPSRETMVELYNAADYFICPSENEGFGLTVGEAMACGCCVLTTDNGGVSDLVIEGLTGYYIDFKKKEELKDRLLDITRKDNKNIKLNSITHIEENFRWSLSKRKLLEYVK
ncbi:glycosyltransferase [Aeromonas enteropelogenes]|uniref:glycosyltransferase family 4 protein n=1 Tax=Aeromonas enteropelogenes TaxID=29489 RepID=UPI00191D0560|nr:glycosyltransferase [Aeromonas enteropelogenes]MBL0455924.1 glycosyltransferase [Aeromonas enteropelogenes]